MYLLCEVIALLALNDELRGDTVGHRADGASTILVGPESLQRARGFTGSLTRPPPPHQHVASTRPVRLNTSSIHLHSRPFTSTTTPLSEASKLVHTSRLLHSTSFYQCSFRIVRFIPFFSVFSNSNTHNGCVAITVARWQPRAEPAPLAQVPHGGSSRRHGHQL